MVFLKNGKLAWIIPSAFFISNVVAAHPGALDSHGCHTNHKTGEYHCHRQKPGSTLSSKDGAIGTATVIDGDTIEIRGQRIRLYGIDNWPHFSGKTVHLAPVLRRRKNVAPCRTGAGLSVI
jgi:hypothetical protein